MNNNQKIVAVSRFTRPTCDTGLLYIIQLFQKIAKNYSNIKQSTNRFANLVLNTCVTF